jgi:mRNA-degrading endonuclease RelE of RelBE toxin-antitoxin system
MKCEIIAVDNFRREAKRLGKKYRSLKDELAELGDNLEVEPRTGLSLGNDIYKIRIAVRSKGRGKSGGLRVITRVVEVQVKVVDSNKKCVVYLLSIYDKSEMPSISDKRLKEIIESISKSN